jgi:hypothetical protein
MTGLDPEPADRAVARILAGGQPDITEPATLARSELADCACLACADTGHACEDHPDFPWEGIHGPTALHPEHGGLGIPCPACCDPIPADGQHSISDAFTPRHLR